MKPKDEHVTDSLVRKIFHNYSNHYSTNPVLQGITVVDAYRDWTRTALHAASSAVLKLVSATGDSIGLCVTDVENDVNDEILLAGIVPDERKRGAYPEMLKLIGERAQDFNKESVVVSTQAANSVVIRAWCRLGFLPAVVLNTIHVVRRDVFEAALED